MNVLKNKTAIILAGGKSSRMGTDKGFTLLHGKPLIRITIDLLKPLFSDLLIIANDPAYTQFELPVYDDLVKNRGPLGGIYSGLMHSTTPWNFFIACDMPVMNSGVIEKLVRHLGENDAVVPSRNGFPEPLCAFYNKSCLPLVEKKLSLGHNKLQNILPILNTLQVDFTEEYLSGSNPFRNVNTMEELLNVEKS